MHKRTAHNDTEPIEEEQEAFFEPPPGKGFFQYVYVCVWKSTVMNVIYDLKHFLKS